MVYTATDLLKRHWDGHLPVDPVHIAQRMGVDVLPRLRLAGGESGMIEARDDGKVVISYAATEPEVRQRFTVAHEIGHFALGHLKEGQTCFRDSRRDFTSGHWDPREVQANRFAADLLMPDFIVRHVVGELGVRDVGDLAKLFNVSEVAMGYRIKHLGF